MDTVSIRGLSVHAVIGAYDWERDTEQRLVFNVDMATDAARAATSDELVDAVNYAAVAEAITAVVRDGRYQLIETAAERVAERLLADFGLSWLRVEVIKPRPAEGFSAAITIERTSVPAREAARIASALKAVEDGTRGYRSLRSPQGNRNDPDCPP